MLASFPESYEQTLYRRLGLFEDMNRRVVVEGNGLSVCYLVITHEAILDEAKNINMFLNSEFCVQDVANTSFVNLDQGQRENIIEYLMVKHLEHHPPAPALYDWPAWALISAFTVQGSSIKVVLDSYKEHTHILYAYTPGEITRKHWEYEEKKRTPEDEVEYFDQYANWKIEQGHMKDMYELYDEEEFQKMRADEARKDEEFEARERRKERDSYDPDNDSQEDRDSELSTEYEDEVCII